MRDGPATEYAKRKRDTIIAAVIREVAELPDRTSPPDQPDAMVVTESELRAILLEYLPLSA